MYKSKKFGSTQIIWEQESKLDKARKRISSILRLRVVPPNQSNGPIEVLRSILLPMLDFKGGDVKQAKMNWIVSGNLEKIAGHLGQDHFRTPTLLGPNIEFEKYTKSLAKFKNFFLLVPSDWVVPILEARLNIPIEKIKVWPAGIDTEYWRPKNRMAKKVLIYCKYDTSQELDAVTEYLKSVRIEYLVLNYGSYSQNSFKKSLNECLAAIWLCGTESQGIAMMQAWSMDVPTLVRRKSNFKDEVTGKEFESSSAPYLTKLTGAFSVTEHMGVDDVKTFLLNLDRYEPRRYVIENFTVNQQLTVARKLFHELSS